MHLLTCVLRHSIKGFELNMEVEIHATTHVGRVRSGNEDDYLLLNLSDSTFFTKSNDSDDFIIQSENFEVSEKAVVLAVADGCGGASGGDRASNLAVESVKNILTGEVANVDSSFSESEVIKKLYDATLYANLQIHKVGRLTPEYNGMGSTLTAAAITLKTIDFVQVGDSRGYLIRKGKIHQITKDQTLANQLVDAGQISPEEAETHTFKNVILQALGAQTEIYPDATRLIPQSDDVLLLCSDGLSNEIKSDELLQIIMNNLDNLENACKVLIQKAIKNGGHDNITVILAKLTENELSKPTNDLIEVYPLKFDNKN
jgi:PPM family protein phosphatase